MSYETRIGWRYLFRRNRKRSLTGLCAVLLLGAAIPLVTLQGASLLRVGPPAFSAALLAVVVGLLAYFSVFTTVAILGVTMGMTALLVVMSVTSGFQEVFKEKVLGVNAHVIIMKWGPDFSEYPAVQKQVEKLPEVVAASPFVFHEVQIARGTDQTTVLVKGIDPSSSLRVLNVGSQMVEGRAEDLAQTPPGVLLGRELAKKLRIHRGDRIKLLPPLFGLTAAQQNLPASGDFVVRGIFDAGFDEYDRRLIYLGIADAQQLAGRGNVASGVEIRLRNPDGAKAMARSLERVLGGAPYRIIDWEELNHNLFAALKLQKFVIALFLTIIIVVAAFNIVASLTLVVLSKRKEIAILKSMGVPPRAMVRIFQVAGLTIGLVGVATGIGLGLLVCAIASRYGYPLDPKIYLISRLPVHVRGVEVMVTAAITLLICLLATLYPSKKASRLHPVEGLRGE